MPYVDLFSSNDYATIWYETNSRFGNVGSFDPDKPTIVMLHPVFLDSSWLDSQFNDPRLNSAFNMIAIDMRVCGKSSARPSGLHDSWVDAADLAFVFQVGLSSFLVSFFVSSRRRTAIASTTRSHPRIGKHLNKLRAQIRRPVCACQLCVPDHSHDRPLQLS